MKIPELFILWSNLRQQVFIFTLWSNYLYIQLTFVFNPLEVFDITDDHIDVSFLFLFQKDSYISLISILILFVFFFFRKVLVPFRSPFWQLVLSVFLTFFNIFMYRKKNYKKHFISFFLYFKNERYHMSYVNNMYYVSHMSYVINMSFVKLSELRDKLSKFYEYFYESLKIKYFFSQYIRLNLRH